MRRRNLIYFKPRKYGNITCAVDGHNFDSRREAAYYGQLKMEKRAKLIKDFKMQVTFPLFAAGGLELEPEFARRRQVCQHRVDFLVTLPNGTQEAREVKGYATPVWDLKRKIFESNYPEIEYKVIN